ncbi:MAG: DUF4832 domain-containing protein [Chloroflexi bacterium]|nr:DUF4832 domain-containing protein [Chloroflexota bacterium]
MPTKNKQYTRIFFISLLLAAALFGFALVYPGDLMGGMLDALKKGRDNLALGKGQVIVFPVAYQGYLANPGAGWQGDFSTYSSYFPETVHYSTRIDIPWKRLNPAEGVYDWALLDEQLARAVADGKQYSFRVFTMSGEGYGGHQIPAWVLERGAVLLPSGEPDYSNCVYQEEWGKFVNALIERYDGNPDIAFLDISGYGNFNEWSWQSQTEWDDLWAERYEQRAAGPSTMENLDGEARRRLADIFIGGSYESHRCRSASGQTLSVNYSYPGAQKTQLVMPYAGIVQSTQYVFVRRKDVGFRFDCLGRDTLDDLPAEVLELWRNAPVVYEFCGPRSFQMDRAQALVEATHPILIHNNAYEGDVNELQELLTPVGYRFFLKRASANAVGNAGEDLPVSMVWQNLGTSPIYPKMGQIPVLYLYLIDRGSGEIALSQPVEADISAWLPAHPFPSSNPPEYRVDVNLPLASNLPAGTYALTVAIIETRTGAPIQLAVEGMTTSGQFFLFDITVK